MKKDEIIELALRLGATNAVPVNISEIKYYPELRPMCEMNSCGKFDSNWACPPACGDIETLSASLAAYKNGVAYQYIGKLEDSFDIENMQEAGRIFSEIAITLHRQLQKDCLVLGGGSCSVCPQCSYPEPCLHPEDLIIPVEAYGINVSELCTLAGIKYINGANTVTYTGLVAFDD